MSKIINCTINLDSALDYGASQFNATTQALAISVGLLAADLALSTSYAAVPVFGLSSVKSIVIKPDPTIAVVLSLDGGTTDHMTIPAAGLPVLLPFPATLHVKSASGTPTLNYAIIK